MEKETKSVRAAVYISVIPSISEIDSVFPPERDAEIKKTKNERLKREKYYVWRLLEYALTDALGIDIKAAKIKKNPNGRWCSQVCDFSLSHTDGAVAAAVSDSPIGVDIEAVREPRSSRFAHRILTETEKTEYSVLGKGEQTEYLIKRWTEKEAIFKLKNEEKFLPARTESDFDMSVMTDKFLFQDKEYIFSVAHQSDTVRIFTDVKLVE